MYAFKENGMWTKIITRMLCVIFPAAVALADEGDTTTWHLNQDQSWENVADDTNGKYLLALSRIKQMVSSGQTQSVLGELAQLKNDFPDIAGPDLDLFMEAELLYAHSKWNKAVLKYNEMLDSFPGSWLQGSAMERLFSIGTAFLGGEKRQVLKILKLSAYEEGEKIMRRIADRAGDAPIAKRALEAVAESYEKRGLYLDAFEAWADISTKWPTGDMGRESLLRMAQSLHSAYKGPKYDAESLASTQTFSAQSLYNDFRLRYPELVEEYEIDAKMKMIDEQMAYKQFKIGEYYTKTDSFESANLYYQLVIDNWPDSKAARMARARIEQSAPDNQEASSGQKHRGLGRGLFDAGNKLLDNWFNILNF